MPVTRDEVIWGYRYILGRDPEDELTIEHHSRARDVRTFRRNLLDSQEFEQVAIDRMAHDHAPGGERSGPAAVFLHVPKCGGTTLHNLLVRNYSADEVCPERFNGLYNWPLGRLGAFRLFSGHFDMPSVRMLPGDKRVVTMLREPKARLVSAYYFLKAHRHDAPVHHELGLSRLANSETLEGFLLHAAVQRHSSINNCMVRTFSGCLPRRRWEALAGSDSPGFIDVDPEGALEAAKGALAECAAVGLVERYDESVRVILNALGFVRPTGDIERHQVLDVIMHENSGLKPVSREAPLADDHPALLRHTCLDSKLYDYACELLDRRHEINDIVRTSAPLRIGA